MHRSLIDPPARDVTFNVESPTPSGQTPRTVAGVVGHSHGHRRIDLPKLSWGKAAISALLLDEDEIMEAHVVDLGGNPLLVRLARCTIGPMEGCSRLENSACALGLVSWGAALFTAVPTRRTIVRFEESLPGALLDAQHVGILRLRLRLWKVELPYVEHRPERPSRVRPSCDRSSI